MMTSKAVSVPMGHKHSHFQGKQAMEHVAETQASGILTSTEIHGTEAPGYATAALDAMGNRETTTDDSQLCFGRSCI